MTRVLRPSSALLVGLLTALGPAAVWAQENEGADVDDVMMRVVKDPNATEGAFAEDIMLPPGAADTPAEGRAGPGDKATGQERASEASAFGGSRPGGGPPDDRPGRGPPEDRPGGGPPNDDRPGGGPPDDTPGRGRPGN